MKRTFFTESASLLAGLFAGALFAFCIARSIQLHAGRSDLRAYTERLLTTAEQLAAETELAVSQATTNNLVPCSDQDIAWMRKFVFGASHVKDIARIRDNMLLCSTGTGRLDPPRPLLPPTLTFSGINVYLNAPILISRGATALIVQKQGISVVLNPSVYHNLDQPSRFYSGYIYDGEHARAIFGFGHATPLASSDVLAQRFVERGAFVYLPLCSFRSMVCVVGAESRHAMLSRSSGLFAGFLLGGALLGVALAHNLLLLDQRRSSLHQQLRRAIRKGALTLVYQPVVDLETHAILGAEALVRWTDESGEAVRPDLFIPLAEKHGLIPSLTRHVVTCALQELASLLIPGDFHLTINITAQDLADPTFVPFLDRTFAAAGIPHRSVGFELTERSTANQPIAIEAITRLRRAGHSVYLDDFGTGYSSLSYLHDLAVDAIKIDRSFTQTVGTGSVTASVVPQILDIANRLHLAVIVEGIETPRQADFFRGRAPGIQGQGWLFSRPVPAPQLQRLLLAFAREQPNPQPSIA